MSPDLRFALQNGVFALTLMPHDACPSLVCILSRIVIINHVCFIYPITIQVTP